MATKNCSKCGTSFGCCNEKPGCWCENYQVPVDTLQQLRNEFENCLCEACLRMYSVEQGTQEK